MAKKRVLLLLQVAALVCVPLALAAWGPLLPVGAAAAEDDVADAGEVMEALKEAVEGLSEESAADLRETLRKGKEALEEGGVPLEAIVERLDKLEQHQQSQQQQRPPPPSSASADFEKKGSSSALSVEALEDDSKSLLEVVSHILFEYVTTRLTPRTDRECRWSYRRGMCVPRCACKYQFQLGDYTLSRSCRLNPNATEVAACDPLAKDGSDDHMLVKAQRVVVRSLSKLNDVLDKYAPATDSECDWRWTSLRCEPREACRFYYKLGDYHIGRSCRLRSSVEAERAAKEAAAATAVDEEEEEEEYYDDDAEEEEGEEEDEEEEGSDEL